MAQILLMLVNDTALMIAVTDDPATARRNAGAALSRLITGLRTRALTHFRGVPYRDAATQQSIPRTHSISEGDVSCLLAPAGGQVDSTKSSDEV